MIRGLYTAATGMIHQRNKLDSIANNLANTNTRGYKKDDIVSRSFNDELLLRISKNQSPRALGPINHGVYAERVTTFFQDGPLQQTGLTTDLALQGEGFFTIIRDGQELYTRDGTFKVNDEGILVTMEGHVVAGENGPIQVGQEDFEIDIHGYIWQGYNLVDRLQLVNFEDNNALEKVGDNLFANNNPGENPAIVFDGQVFQGYAELSNVELVDEISDMITVARTYEANMRILQMMDNVLSKTVNEVGTV
ncbi:MAG: flagellar basal-body rod protein FlgF [Caldicoprobacterales bacterium]|jgi:flagellar basal-body rod protein FlgF|nr:flagellar basal-body rod protein FlgF [Clostridiales bacterium]